MYERGGGAACEGACFYGGGIKLAGIKKGEFFERAGRGNVVRVGGRMVEQWCFVGERVERLVRGRVHVDVHPGEYGMNP
jgi:hypothetical protein